MPILAPLEIVEKYFRSWQQHSFADLEAIADPRLRYQIVGKPGFDSLDALKAYWERNKKRQHKLYVEHNVIDHRAETISCDFVASFDDVEEAEHQVVFGRITFHFSLGDNPKLTLLSERYAVRSRPIKYFRLLQMATSSSAGILLAYQVAVRFVEKGRRFLTVAGRCALVAAGGLAIYLYFWPAPEWLVRAMMPSTYNGFSSTLPAGSVEKTSKEISDLILLLFGVGTAFGVLAALFRRKERDDDIQVFELDRAGRDLTLMSDFMQHAKDVIVFSGRFDFLQESPSLLQTLEALSASERLTFVSDRTREAVMEGAIACRRAKQLLSRLELQRKIIYGSDLNLRCSVITDSSAQKVILCRYEASEGGRMLAKMCAIRQRGRAKEIAKAVSEFAQDLVQRMKDIPSFQAGPDSIAIVVTGETKSGKSALAQLLANHDFHLVRAGEVIGELITPSPTSHTRRELLEEGKSFLSAEKQSEFGAILYGRSIGFKKVVFDGIRLPGAVERIRQGFGRVFLIYVEADPKIRRERYDAHGDGSISFDEVANHPVEQAVLAMRKHNDLILDGAGSLESNLERALHNIEHFCKK